MQLISRRTNANRRSTAAHISSLVTPPVPGRFSVSALLSTPSPPDIPPHGVAGGFGTESTLAGLRLDVGSSA